MKTYQDCLKAERAIQEVIDILYEVASQKRSVGDTNGQQETYKVIDKLQSQKDALVNPEADSIPADPAELDLVFDS